MIRGCIAKKNSIALGLFFLTAALAQPGNGWAQDAGEQLFQTACSACHLIGGGRLVGPDLAGVSERRSQDWLARFVKSPQAMIKDGDADAVALFEEFNGIMMPDFAGSDAEVAQLLGYIDAKSAGAAAPDDKGAAEVSTAEVSTAEVSTAEVTASLEPASPEHVAMGRDLFQGTIRLQNGGSPCNACHDVKNDAVIGGGILASELTTVFSKMGGSGVGAILGQAPFPVMQAAYKKNPLTEDEITYLVAFLQDADAQHLFHEPRDYGYGLFFSGTIGAGVMFLVFAVVWRGRKRGSVNQKIYDRQIKSVTDHTNP